MYCIRLHVYLGREREREIYHKELTCTFVRAG